VREYDVYYTSLPPLPSLPDPSCSPLPVSNALNTLCIPLILARVPAGFKHLKSSKCNSVASTPAGTPAPKKKKKTSPAAGAKDEDEDTTDTD
jgi:hypothetical protein